jgi:hypothetical protein
VEVKESSWTVSLCTCIGRVILVTTKTYVVASHSISVGVYCMLVGDGGLEGVSELSMYEVGG